MVESISFVKLNPRIYKHKKFFFSFFKNKLLQSLKQNKNMAELTECKNIPNENGLINECVHNII